MSVLEHPLLAPLRVRGCGRSTCHFIHMVLQERRMSSSSEHFSNRFFVRPFLKDASCHISARSSPSACTLEKPASQKTLLIQCSSPFKGRRYAKGGPSIAFRTENTWLRTLLHPLIGQAAIMSATPNNGEGGSQEQGRESYRCDV